MISSSRQVPRPRLRDALLDADCRLRLLWAPAGSGKSVLLSECMGSVPADTRVVYIDLHGYIDLPTLNARLAQALGLAEDTSGRLGEHLAARHSPLWLVLDDFPRFADEQFDSGLNQLLQASSTSVRWWIASRRRPRLQLTRLLLEGELFELGARELAFTEAEVVELLGSDVDPTEVMSRTGGWCAGVRLELLGARASQTALGEGVSALTQDYLRREVLDELPGDWQLALFSLAQFPQFDHDLCEQVLGVGEGRKLLEQLYECGLFIETLHQDRHLLRVQPALAPLLAGQMPASMTKALFRQACQWFLGQGKIREALEYALKAGQPEVAASLMQRFTEDQLLQGQGVARIMEWRREMPAELLISTPRLILLNSWTSLLSGHLEDGQHYMAALEHLMPQPSAAQQFSLIAQYKALSAELAVQQGDGLRAEQMASEAIAELPEEAWGQRLLCQLLQVEGALIKGNFEQARQLNRIAIKQAREQGSGPFESLLALEHAKLLELRGELLRSESLLRRLHAELVGAWDDEPSPIRGRIQLLLANLLLQRGCYQDAEASFVVGIRECVKGADPAFAWGSLGLAELRALHGQFGEAFASITEVERSMQYAHIDTELYRIPVQLTKARLWLMQQRNERAERAILELLVDSERRPPFGFPDLHLRLHMLLAQSRLPGEQRKAALESLQTLHAQAVSEGRRPLVCELGFMLAEGFHAEGRHVQSKQMLLDSLALARQLGLVSVERAFAQRNPSMRHWAQDGNADSEEAPLLSQRELEVLRLIARGMSNQQIAEMLFISLHTVKTHAQRINFKLGVERRTQAVARAKELGVLA